MARNGRAGRKEKLRRARRLEIELMQMKEKCNNLEKPKIKQDIRGQNLIDADHIQFLLNRPHIWAFGLSTEIHKDPVLETDNLPEKS